jgi:hypothetical protein
MDTTLNPLATSELARRVRAEFMEMPGLRLNVRQAERLWGLDALPCQAVLDALVERGVLTHTRHVYSLGGSQPRGAREILR